MCIECFRLNTIRFIAGISACQCDAEHFHLNVTYSLRSILHLAIDLQLFSFRIKWNSSVVCSALFVHSLGYVCEEFLW